MNQPDYAISKRVAHTALRADVERLTGIAVREASAKLEPSTGAVVQLFATGTMVQVFQLAAGLSAETWNGSTLS